MNDFLVKKIWGDYNFDFAVTNARDNSGGIMSMWDKRLFSKKNALLVLDGDFNSIRDPTEKNWIFFIFEAIRSFNEFISDAHNTELPCTDKRFIWSNRAGSKLSKIDRIFVSEKFLEIWSNSCFAILPRDKSNPITVLLDF